MTVSSNVGLNEAQQQCKHWAGKGKFPLPDTVWGACLKALAAPLLDVQEGLQRSLDPRLPSQVKTGMGTGKCPIIPNP